jgi:hypothetical protein
LGRSWSRVRPRSSRQPKLSHFYETLPGQLVVTVMHRWALGGVLWAARFSTASSGSTGGCIVSIMSFTYYINSNSHMICFERTVRFQYCGDHRSARDRCCLPLEGPLFSYGLPASALTNQQPPDCAQHRHQAQFSSATRSTQPIATQELLQVLAVPSTCLPNQAQYPSLRVHCISLAYLCSVTAPSTDRRNLSRASTICHNGCCQRSRSTPRGGCPRC